MKVALFNEPFTIVVGGSRMIRSHKVVPTEDGKFAVVSEQDGSVGATYDEEWLADHMVSEGFCDDEAMIRHEEAT